MNRYLMFRDQIARLELLRAHRTAQCRHHRRSWTEFMLNLAIAFLTVDMILIGKHECPVECLLAMIAEETSGMEDTFAIDQGDLIDDFQALETHGCHTKVACVTQEMCLLSLTRIFVTIIEPASQGRVTRRTGVASNVNRRFIVVQIVVIGRDRLSTGLTSTSIEIRN